MAQPTFTDSAPTRSISPASATAGTWPHAGLFTTFATGFAFISILTGAFQLFAFAFGTAGPAFWWTWLVALGGQALFALCFAELAVHYPMAGSIYNWAKQVGRPTTAWMAGFSLTLALIVSTAAVGLAMQFVLPTISSVFWIYGNGSGTYDAATNGVILGAIAITLTTVVNLLGPQGRGDCEQHRRCR